MLTVHSTSPAALHECWPFVRHAAQSGWSLGHVTWPGGHVMQYPAAAAVALSPPPSALHEEHSLEADWSVPPPRM